MGSGKNNLFIALTGGMLLFSANVHAGGSPSASELRAAFDAGIKQHEISTPPKLEISHAGNAARLTVESGGKEILSLTCLLCTPSEMISGARALGATWSNLKQNRHNATVTFIDTADSVLWLDGIPAAPIEGRHPVAEGTVTVTAKKGGQVTRGRIEITADTRDITVSLNDLRVEKVDPRMPAAIVLTGLAWSAAAASGIFFAMNGDCTEDTCHYQYQLKTPGIISAVVAGVLQVAGAALFGISFSSR